MSINTAQARVQEILTLAGQLHAPEPALPSAATPPDNAHAFAQQLANAQKTTGPQTANPAATPIAQAAVPPATGPHAPVGPASVSMDDTALAAHLDAWMGRKVSGSPLVGMGAEFVAAGKQHGIDPRFLVAVAHQESVLGTAGSGKNIHNAFGWGPAIRFSSWPENIRTVAAGLAKGYLGEGRDTIAAIQAKWAPVGASNDPGGLNSHWTTGVSRFYSELGGDPKGSVRLR